MLKLFYNLIFGLLVSVTLYGQQSNQSLVGAEAPGFYLMDTKQQEFFLSQNLDKPIFINFFNTHCSPCLAEIPDLIAFYNKHQNKMEMVMIDYVMFSYAFIDRKETVNDVEKALKRFKIPFRILMDNYGIVTDAYGVVDIPVSFLIDTDGKIIWQHKGRCTIKDLQKLEEQYEAIF